MSQQSYLVCIQKQLKEQSEVQQPAVAFQQSCSLVLLSVLQ